MSTPETAEAVLTRRVVARNDAEASENRIHDDRVAAEYGFRGGLVPGVTVYAYLLAFQGIDFGHAAAVSYIALAISLVLLAILYGVPWLMAKRGAI